MGNGLDLDRLKLIIGYDDGFRVGAIFDELLRGGSRSPFAKNVKGVPFERHPLMYFASSRLLHLEGRLQDELARVDDTIGGWITFEIGFDHLQSAALEGIVDVELNLHVDPIVHDRTRVGEP